MTEAKWTTAEEAVKLIKSYDHIYIQGSTSIPEVLCDALAARAGELRGVVVYSGFAVGRREAPYCRSEYRESCFPLSHFIAHTVSDSKGRGAGLRTFASAVREGGGRVALCHHRLLRRQPVPRRRAPEADGGVRSPCGEDP